MFPCGSPCKRIAFVEFPGDSF